MAIFGRKQYTKLIRTGNRRFGQRRRHEVLLPDGTRRHEMTWHRPTVWVALVCAFVVCLLLFVSVADNVGTGLGWIVGGSLALYLFWRQRLRRP